MLAEELIRKGNLKEALAELQGTIRKNPEVARYRVFLFQLLAVDGQWDRALTQLNVAGDLDPATLAMVQTYREALRCEVLRHDVFSSGRSPLVFGQPQQWVALMIEALNLDAQGHHSQAKLLRDQALEEAPATTGSITTSNEENIAFTWLADADTRLGPVIEAVINGRYYWVPMSCITTIHVEAPEDLRDLVWMPVHFTWTNGGETVGLIPTRYPQSECSEDPLIRMSRKTQWDEQIEGCCTGLGQRLLATDHSDYSLMDIRTINLNNSET